MDSYLCQVYWLNITKIYLRSDVQCCVLLVRGENSPLWRVLPLRKGV